MVIKQAKMFMAFTNEQIEEAGQKALERQEKQKAYDKWYLAKTRHDLAEFKRVVRENDLQGQLIPFSQSKEDYA